MYNFNLLHKFVIKSMILILKNNYFECSINAAIILTKYIYKSK